MPHLNRTTSGVLGGLAGLVGLSAVAGILVTATVTPAIAVSGYAASSALDTFENMPSFLEIDPLMLPTEFYRKDSAGNDTLMAQFYDQNRVPVTFDQVNPVMFDAITSGEDKNFYSHGGVNIGATVLRCAEWRGWSIAMKLSRRRSGGTSRIVMPPSDAAEENTEWLVSMSMMSL